ncbi:hypothetical protein Tco_0508581 [Tanacetum coccineum]
MKAVFENMEAKVDQNTVDKKCKEIEHWNLLIMNENLIAECLSKDVFYTATDSVLNIQNDDHDSMIKHFSKLEVEHFNLQLKYQNLKERFGNKKPVTSSDDPSFDSLFVIGQLNEQIQSRGNTIHELKEKISRLTRKNSDANPIFDPKALVSQNKDLTAKLNALHDLNEQFRAENAKVKQHYKELYDSIKITRAKTNDQKNSLLTEIENLKTQLKGKMPCVTIDVKTPKVSAFEKYAIDVEPIPPRQRSNRNVHHGYLNSLKDSNLDYACVYTKRSQELLANASASCPKAVNKQDKFIATTPVTKKKRVTFADPLETSGNNTPKHVKQQSVQPTNVPILPSTGVNTATTASGSKPKSNIKKDKTLPAKSVPKKKVEDHLRNNKSKLRKKNRVDSCTSVRSTVCDTNSNSLCKICNECINSNSHDKCVDKSLKFSKPTPVRKIWIVKQVKQTWQPTGKLFTTVGHHWKPTGRTFPLGAQCPLTRKTTPKVVPVKIWKPTGRIISLRGQCPLTRPTALTSDVVLADPQAHHAPVDYNIVCSNQLDPNIDWGSNVSNSPFSYFRLQPGFQNEESSSPKRRLFLTTVTMVDVNVNAPKVPSAADAPPTRSDEQIMPHKGYSCQLDEHRFSLTKATLRDALQLPADNDNFTPPPNVSTIISFVNDLGCPNAVKNISGIVTNDMYQLWRALVTIINLCLTGKTSGFKRPRAPVLQILWGIVNRADIDYAERIWEEFT